MAGSTDPTVSAIVPFTVERAAARSVLAGWLRSRRFAPDALRELTGPDALRSSYLPQWSISTRTRSDYTGKRGKHYWVTHNSSSTDAHGNTTTHTHQQRHTRWKPASGTVTRDFADILVVATGSQEPKRLAKVAPWPLAQAVPFEPDHLHGHDRLPSDTPPEEALARAKVEMARVIERDCRQDIGGDGQRIDSVRTSYSDVTVKLVLFLVWIGSYQYDGRRWEVLINGCTGEIHGDRPYSVAKIAVAVAGGLVVVAAIIAVVLLAGP